MLSPISMSKIAGTKVELQAAGANYVESSETNCPITNYAVSVKSGDAGNIIMASDTGKMDLFIDKA